MKFLTNWKFVFIMTVLILFSLYVGVLYTYDTSLPSEGWSNSQTIRTLEASKKEFLRDENFFTLPIYEEEVFLTIWSRNNSIHYSITNKHGEVKSGNQLNIDTYNPFKIRAVNNGDIVNLLVLEDKQLKRYDFNWKTGNIEHEQVIAEEISDFVLENDLIALMGMDDFKIIDIDNDLKYSEEIRVNDIAITKFGSNFHFAYINGTQSGIPELTYMLYDPATNDIRIEKLSNILFKANGKLNISVINEEVNIIVPNYDSKTTQMNSHVYSFSVNDVSSLTESSFRGLGMADTLRVVKSDSDKLQFIMPSRLVMGSKNDTLNLILYTYENKEITEKRLLTKTKDISLNPYYFKLGDNEYVQWLDKKWEKNKGNSIEIRFASTSSEIIDKSQGYDLSQWTSLILDSLISVLAIVASAAQPLLAILMPTALIMTIWSSLKVYWAEKNPIKMFNIGLVTHNVIKSIFVAFVIWPNATVLYSFPKFLNRLDVLITMLVISTLIAIYCTLNYSTKEKHFLGTYIFYGVIDIVFFSLIIYPYFAAFKLFDYIIIS